MGSNVSTGELPSAELVCSVELIRAMRAWGLSDADIARRLKVRTERVRQMVRQYEIRVAAMQARERSEFNDGFTLWRLSNAMLAGEFEMPTPAART